MIQQTEKQITISDDGTAVFDGFFSNELCDNYIKYFNDRETAGFTHDRWTSQRMKPITMQDSQAFLTNGDFLTDVDTKLVSEQFLKIFWEEIYKTYVQKFSVLENYASHKIYHLKLQKTLPTQGYHVWHSENGTRESSNRILVFILYLNDVEEGGETEFLYIKRRVTAKKGRLLLWPSGFTHTHRGNPPLSGEKYIMTGWVEF